MLSSEEYKELIDSYIKGTLHPDESAKLEQELGSNPVLKNELSLQQSIVATVQANRKAELKARLNNIQVSAGIQWWKYAAMVGAVASISTLLYLGYSTKKELEAPSIVVKDVPVDETPQLIVEEQKEATNRSSSSRKKSIAESATTSADSKNIKTVATSKKREFSSSKEQEPLPNLPNVHSPETPGTDPHIVKDDRSPDHSFGKTKHVSTAVAGVEVVPSKKHKFHYRYFDNKIFLYGNFDMKTYEILELNTSKGQKMYLKFESNYYELAPNQTEIAKLEQVKERGTLRELEEYQKK